MRHCFPQIYLIFLHIIYNITKQCLFYSIDASIISHILAMGMIVYVSMVTKSNHFIKYSIGKFLKQTFKDGYQNGCLKCIKNHSVIYVVAPFLIGVFCNQ